MQNELSVKIIATATQANNELKSLQKTLNGTGQNVSRIGKVFDKNGNLVSQTITSVTRKGNTLYRTIQRLDADGNLRSVSQNMSQVKKNTDMATGAFAKLRSIISMGILIGGFGKLSKAIYDVTTKSIDFSESLNLFNVVFKNVENDGETTFSEVGKKADEFQDKLEKNFGANRTESMYYQSLYQAMANAQGIADQYAQIMSENSTKLTYDLSSLFNKNQEDVAEALRAGIYAGQTKPLRSYGIDVTETTLQGTLDKLKETNAELSNLNVSTMSQAEKQILRYISVLEQASVAQGDFANTIDSPANQLKILQNQLTEMAVAVGNLFVAPFQKVLTYANSIIIVIKQVAQAIASFFNIKISDNNSGIASAEDLSDSYEDIGTSAGDASKKVKELKRQTLGFDQINNISENKDSGSGGSSGSGSGSGINQALLDSLKGYDNGLDRVKLKAQAIADSIMKWLGFTYDAEEGVWKLGSAYDNLITSCKKFGKALGILGGYAFNNLENLYNNVLKPLGKWTLGTGLPKFLDITANGIMKTDWGNLNNKLNDFYKALTPFAINVGEGLLWFYEKVLTPLASWTIGNVLPEFIQFLASILKILNNTIDTMKPALTFLWDNFLSPIAKWTGGIAVDVLKDINSVFGLIAKSKVANTVITLGTAFLLVKSSGSLFKGILDKLSSGFVKLTTVTEKNTAKSKDEKAIVDAIAKSGNNASDSLSSTKQNGLGKVISALTTGVKNFLSPTAKLITNITNVKSRTEDLNKKIKEQTSLFDKLETKMNDIKSKANNLKTSVSGLGDKFKNMFTQMKDGINYWSQTTSGIDKMKTAITGISGTVLSLQGLSNSLKDISTEGANLGNVSTTIASGIGTISSAVTTGASVGGIYGAVIGGVVGTVATLVTTMSTYNSVTSQTKPIIDELNTSYDSYKTKMSEINSSYTSAIESAQKSSEIKMIEIANAQELQTQLESFIDVNGKVKTGYEERADVILNQLNEALGTEFKLEDGVITNAGEMVSSKQAFIDICYQSADAIKKETLMEGYQSVYKSAIDAQVEAKKAYNNEIDTETNLLEKTLKKYEENKISAKDLQKVYDEATEKKKSAEKKYQDVLNKTNGTIDGLKDVTNAYAKGTSKELEDTITKVTSSNKKSTKETADNFDTLGKKVKDSLKNAEDSSKTLKKELDKLNDKDVMITFNAKTTGARSEANRFIDDVNKAYGTADAKRAGLNAHINRIPAYANGGFPEDGIFMANHSELVGKFSNGKTAVANNQQITEGIKLAVMQGMSQVMSSYSNVSNVQIDVRADEGIIVEKAVKGINGITDRTGECPIRVM